jgi:acyl-CoA thioesterase FadM
VYVIFRLIYVFLRARRAARQKPTERVETTLIVFPNDLDLNFHVNNGRYLTLMDLGRYDLILRTGLWPMLKKEGWYPVLSTASIRFRRSLRLFQRFNLSTQIVWWDEKWFFIEHQITVGGELYARALVKGLFRDRNGNVSVERMLKAAGQEAPDPGEAPEIVRTWSLTDRPAK